MMRRTRRTARCRVRSEQSDKKREDENQVDRRIFYVVARNTRPGPRDRRSAESRRHRGKQKFPLQMQFIHGFIYGNGKTAMNNGIRSPLYYIGIAERSSRKSTL